MLTTRVRSVLLCIILNTALSAQENKAVDAAFAVCIQDSLFKGIVDTLPLLSFEDSIVIEAQELFTIASICNQTKVPVSIQHKEWRLIHWNSIPLMVSNAKLEVLCEEKLFNRYEITFWIPLLNPKGHKRRNGECCDDSRYIYMGRYRVTERNDKLTVQKLQTFFSLNVRCVKFL